MRKTRVPTEWSPFERIAADPPAPGAVRRHTCCEKALGRDPAQSARYQCEMVAKPSRRGRCPENEENGMTEQNPGLKAKALHGNP